MISKGYTIFRRSNHSDSQNTCEQIASHSSTSQDTHIHFIIWQVKRWQWKTNFICHINQGGGRKKIAEQMMKKSVFVINRPTHPSSSKICKFFQASTNTQPLSSKICKFFPRPTTTHPFFSEI